MDDMDVIETANSRGEIVSGSVVRLKFDGQLYDVLDVHKNSLVISARGCFCQLEVDKGEVEAV
jgi:hypothetical protein